MTKLYKSKKSKSSNVYNSIDDIVKGVYVPKKIDNLRVANLMSQCEDLETNSIQNRVNTMLQCGSYLEFGSPVNIDGGEILYKKSKVVKASLCKDRLCPVCQYRLSRKHQANLSNVINLLNDTGYRFLFVTLTIPNCKGDDIRDTISYLNKSWFRFYHLKRVKSSWLGYYKTIEVTYNKIKKTYHPHIHLMVVVKKEYFRYHNCNDSYLTHCEISELWAKCNKKLIDEYNSSHSKELTHFQVNVKAIKDLRSAIYELSKYCCKSIDITSETIKDYLVNLGGLRLYEYIGLFKEIYNQLKLNDEELDDLQDDVIYYLTHWNFVNFNYVKDDTKSQFVKGINIYKRGGKKLNE